MSAKNATPATNVIPINFKAKREEQQLLKLILEFSHISESLIDKCQDIAHRIEGIEGLGASLAVEARKDVLAFSRLCWHIRNANGINLLLSNLELRETTREGTS